MELPHICSAFADPDLYTRLSSLQELTEIPFNEENLVSLILPKLFKYLDDCEEVLLLLITQIVNLSNSCQSSSAVLLLITPLEELAGIIDDQVRHNSVEGIIKILNSFSLTEDCAMKILKRLVTEKLSGLISALELISSVFPKISLKKQRKLIHFLLNLYRTSESNAKVKIAELTRTLNNFEPLSCEFNLCIQEFISSPEDLIRICGIDLAIHLKSNIFELDSVVHDGSWRVRYFIGQKISSLIEFSDHQKLCGLVKDYLNDLELAVRNVAFLNLSALFKYTTDEIFISEILTHIQNMSSELPFISFEVISSIVQLCTFVGKRNTEVYLQSALLSLFSSQNTNIELFLMQEIRIIAPVVSEVFLHTHAFPVFFKLLEHKSWKIRAKCLSYLPGLGFLQVDVFNSYFKQYIVTSLNDLVHAVRSEAIKTVSSVYDVYGPEWFEVNLLKDVFDKSKSDCYISRITAVNLLSELVKKFDLDRFGEFFFEIFNRLSTDRVINVRICVSRLSKEVDCSKVLERFKEGFNLSLENLKSDLDCDVRNWVLNET